MVEAPTGFLWRVSFRSGVDGEAVTTVGPPPVVRDVRGSVGWESWALRCRLRRINQQAKMALAMRATTGTATPTPILIAEPPSSPFLADAGDPSLFTQYVEVASTITEAAAKAPSP